MNPADIAARARAKATPGARITDEAKPAPVTVSTDIPAGMEGLKPLADMLKPFLNLNISEAKLKAMVDDAVSRFTPRPTEVTVTLPDGEQKNLGKVHKLVPTAIEWIRLQNIHHRGLYLVGPAGSFKTSGCKAVAEALDLPFYPLSVGPQTSKSDLVGFVDAHGKPVITALRRAYSEGGLVLFDEMDAANAGVFTTINSLLANGEYTWPDGVTTPRHENFRYIAAANTYGTGQNLLYIGRAAQDGATLDRFDQIEWGYDEEFEKYLVLNAAGQVNDSSQGVALKWFTRVVELRKAAERAHVKAIISPRASLSGAVMLAAGQPLALVEKVAISGRLKEDDWKRILEHV